MPVPASGEAGRTRERRWVFIKASVEHSECQCVRSSVRPWAVFWASECVCVCVTSVGKAALKGNREGAPKREDRMSEVEQENQFYVLGDQYQCCVTSKD